MPETSLRTTNLALPAAVAILESIDFLTIGVCLVTADAKVAYANISAADILERADGLHLSSGRLSACLAPECRRLQDGIAVAFQRPADGCLVALPVARPSGYLSYQVTVMPPAGLRRLGGDYATVFVSDPTRDMHPFEDCLMGLYGLTRSESVVAGLIARGLDLRQIAEERNVGFETVRTQLKRVFEKTGTRRQVDLVRVVLCGAATLCCPNGR